MHNLLKRSLSAIAFVIIVVGSALLGVTAFGIVLFIVTVLGLWEFYSLLTSENYHPSKYLSVLLGAVVYLAVAIAPPLADAATFLFVFAILLLFFFVELWRKKTNPFVNISISIAGIVYVAIPLALLTHLLVRGEFEASAWMRAGIVLGYLFMVWMNDTFAYFAGSAFGKHRLFERHSPKKSWEGSIGGAIAALLTAWINTLLFPELLSLANWMIIAVIVVIAGTLGDLVESMLKRSVGVKDSGAIMPGHGGILDRFDADLLSVPFVLVYLTLI